MFAFCAHLAKIRAGAAAVFEEPHLRFLEFQHGIQGVINALDKACRVLRMLIGVPRNLHLLRRSVPVVVAAAALDAVFVPQAAVEPDRRVKRAALRH